MIEPKCTSNNVTFPSLPYDSHIDVKIWDPWLCMCGMMVGVVMGGNGGCLYVGLPLTEVGLPDAAELSCKLTQLSLSNQGPFTQKLFNLLDRQLFLHILSCLEKSSDIFNWKNTSKELRSKDWECFPRRAAVPKKKPRIGER